MSSFVAHTVLDFVKCDFVPRYQLISRCRMYRSTLLSSVLMSSVPYYHMYIVHIKFSVE